MQADLTAETALLKEQGIVPGLVVLLVGEDKASQTYVRNKELAAARIGIRSKVEHYPESITEEELLSEIDKYNQDPDFHGILVQLPLPKQIDEEKVLLAIRPEKMSMVSILSTLVNCLLVFPIESLAPYGIMKMFEAYDIPLEGKMH